MSDTEAERTDHRFHTLVVLVENKPGVLSRVAGLFARRGFNIESLAVAPTDDPLFSRLTITVDVESAPLEQIVKQLDKLINVVDIRDLDPSDAVQRELMMIIVDATPEKRGEVNDLVKLFEARVLNVSADKMMLSLSGTPSRLDDFEDLLRPYGIVELQRTGRIALPRLSKTS